MQILIVGAGALGSLFGGLLARAGNTVQLYNPSNVEHIRAIQTKGLLIEQAGESVRVELLATTEAKEIKEAELVGVFAKAPQTAGAVGQIAPKLNKEQWLLSVQNGTGMEQEILKFISPERFLRGVTAQGATLLAAGRVRWAGVGPTKIGRWQGSCAPEILKIIELFRAAGLETDYSEEVERLLWGKLIINCAINPLTALFDVPNGAIVQDPVLQAIASAVAREVLPVARAHGVTLSETEAISQVETVACKTAENISSMLQDVRRGRPTEIEYINGAVVREGRRLGLATPLNLLLTRLVGLKKGAH